MTRLIFSIMIFTLIQAQVDAASAAEQKDKRGLLPQIQIQGTNETENENKQLTTEILVTKAEVAAIDSLQKLIKRKKNTEAEADLQHRLAELYMRRSRTGRFLDLHQNSKTVQLSSFPEAPGKGIEWIRKATVVYFDIEKRFPKYVDMDTVLFQNAFALQQLGKIPEAEKVYQRLLEKFPKSQLIPDAAVALGELAYDQKRFALALEYFRRAEEFKDSRVYSYSLYKGAWAEYNMHNADGAVKRLLLVLKDAPTDSDETTVNKRKQNLRKEALRDLGLFASETMPAADLYPFFKKITNEEELGQLMSDLSKMFLSHSRHKDQILLLDSFLSSNEENPYRLKARLNLMQSLEQLKDRSQVLKQLRKAADDCLATSAWRKKQTPEKIQEACIDGFRTQSRDIAGKWWEIWSKNQQNKEFAGYTEQALKLVLETEDPQHPDGSTRFAYGELLFQLGRYPEASEQYEKAGADKTLPADKAHDSVYGALFALEKMRMTNAGKPDPTRRKKLATDYVQRFPKGENAGNVILSLAVIEAETKNFSESRKWLKNLLDGSYGRPLQVKAEDVSLDLLNQEKNYVQLTKDATEYASRDRSERSASLKKIATEASYAQLKNDVQKAPESEQATKLQKFATDHQSETLGHDALLEALSIHFKLGLTQKASESVDQILKTKPAEPKLKDILPDLAARLAREGKMKKASAYLLETSTRKPAEANKLKEAAADFLLLDGDGATARGIYRSLLPNADKESRIRLYTKILDSLKGASSDKEKKQLEEMALSQNLEPFATKILTERAQELLKKGQTSAAFEAARKIMSRDRPASERADARLIQAKILEEEFFKQSVKSSKEDRFSMVLSLKTEKLEKAQTAYLSMLKMSEEPRIQAEGLAGVERCLSHYIDSLERLEAPASFSTEEVAALKKELSTLLAPIKVQRDEHRKQAQQISALIASSAAQQWGNLEGKDSPPPVASTSIAYMKPFLIREWSSDGKIPSRYEESKPQCDNKRKSMAACLAAKKWDFADEEASALLAAQKRSWAIHGLALAAEGRGLDDKAIWMLRQLAQTEKNPVITYEIARLTAQRDGLMAATKEFGDLLKSSMDSTEIKTFRCMQSYRQHDYGTVINLCADFSMQGIYNLELGLLLSESYAQTGEVDKALRILADLGKKDPRPELDIQAGRILETFKIAPLPALEKYKLALAKAKDPALQEWLKKKIDFVKINFKVGMNVSSGGF